MRLEKNRRNLDEGRCYSSSESCYRFCCGLFASLGIAARFNSNNRPRHHLAPWPYVNPKQVADPELRPGRFNIRDRFLLKYSHAQPRMNQSPYANRFNGNHMNPRGNVDFQQFKVAPKNKHQRGNWENFPPILLLNNGENHCTCTCRCHLGVPIPSPQGESGETMHKSNLHVPNGAHNYRHNYNYYCYDPVNNIYKLAEGPFRKGILLEENSLCQCKIDEIPEDKQTGTGENNQEQTNANSDNGFSKEVHDQNNYIINKKIHVQLNCPDEFPNSCTDLQPKSVITL